jgi:hypothetical protein
MNHNPASIKKREKESKWRKEDEGKDDWDDGGRKGRRDLTMRNKQGAKTKYVIFTHEYKLLSSAQRARLETQPQSH